MEIIDHSELLEEILDGSKYIIFISDDSSMLYYYNNSFAQLYPKLDTKKNDISLKELFRKDSINIITNKYDELIDEVGLDIVLSDFDNGLNLVLKKTKVFKEYKIFYCELESKANEKQKYREIISDYKLDNISQKIGTWIYNIDKTLTVNDIFKELFEIAESKKLFNPKVPISSFINSNAPEVDHKIFDNALSTKEGFDITLKINAKSGIKHIRMIGQINDLGNGKLELYGVNIDRTDSFLAKKKEGDLTEKIKEAEFLKDAFLQNISHELRTPLNGILGFSGLLADKDLDDEERAEYTGLMKASADRLVNTVDNIIEISKLKTNLYLPKFSTFSAASLIEDLYLLYEPIISKTDLYFETKVEEDIKITSDFHAVNNIFKHLISNAIKFTSKGKIAIGFKCSEDYCRFFVEDTGIGIKQSKRQQIFKQFTQGENSIHRSYEGTGLGLSIAKELLEIIDGEINFDSVEGEGTKFYFDIPLNPTIKNNEMNKEKTKKILIVEDDDASLTLFKILLKKMNFETINAANGIEAIEQVKSNSDIDLILMDMKMPKLDGYEATAKIREFNKDILIVATTADALDFQIKKALDAGCNIHIAKPIDAEVFKKKITELLDEKE